MQPESPKKFPVVAVLISVILTAAIVGGGVYFWQNMQLEESEITTPEATPGQITTTKPSITSPLSGATIENATDGVKITGKAAPNSTVWLFPVSEMNPTCLSMATAETLGDKADASGNFEITYYPTGEMESWPSEFAIVAFGENQKYQLSWVDGVFCAPEEVKSDYFQLTLTTTQATPPTEKKIEEYLFVQDDTYRFRITGTARSCADYYDVKGVESKVDAIKSYGLFVVGSKSGWPSDSPSQTYNILSRETYDKFSPDELPGQPRILLQLAYGELLTAWDPQDSPPDMPQDCRINFEKF